MVRMRVAQNQLVDFLDFQLFQLRHDFIALIQVTGIHENILFPCLDQDGVPLPHIEHGYGHFAFGHPAAGSSPRTGRESVSDAFHTSAAHAKHCHEQQEDKAQTPWQTSHLAPPPSTYS